jgi:hypothetical protein
LGDRSGYRSGEELKMMRIILAGLSMSVYMFLTGCVVATPREGYYDRDNHRYYHEHVWHDCGEHDSYCR